MATVGCPLHAAREGRWYYEVLCDGQTEMQVGWADSNFTIPNDRSSTPVYVVSPLILLLKLPPFCVLTPLTPIQQTTILSTVPTTNRVWVMTSKGVRCRCHCRTKETIVQY